MAPKRRPLGARLSVNTHNMGGHFVESVKNARWLMNPQEAGDGLEDIVEFRVRIKHHDVKLDSLIKKDERVPNAITTSFVQE